MRARLAPRACRVGPGRVYFLGVRRLACAIQRAPRVFPELPRR